jgi:hypothetical protein
VRKVVNKATLPGPQTLLVDLRLDRVDLVHTGSNTRADILLTKGKEQNAMPEDLQGLLGLLKPEQAEIVKSALAAKDTTITELTGKVETLEKAAPPAAAVQTETPAEDILKGASPEVLKMFNTMQATINTLVERDAENLAKSRYEVVKAIPVEEKELMEIVKTASPAVFTVLEKAAKAIEAKVLAPVGKEGGTEIPGADADSLYAKLEKSAEEIMAKEEGLTKEQAFVKACSADPKTYAQYVKEAK